MDPDAADDNFDNIIWYEYFMVLVYLQSNDTGRCRMNKKSTWAVGFALLWRHNERDGVWNYRRLDCLPNRLFRRRSKKTSKLRATAFCEGNSPVTGEFPAQRASNAEKFPFDDVVMI